VLTGVLAICCLNLAFGQPAHATRQSDEARDNDRRKLAAAGTASSRATSGEVSVDQVIQGARTRIVSELNARDIKVNVPPIKLSKDLESTCNSCLKNSKTAMVFAHEHAAEMTYWLGRYMKQMISPPIITPVVLHDHRLVPSNLYRANSSLYLTDEGRLKRVVDR
jgi:hypothetical protein